MPSSVMWLLIGCVAVILACIAVLFKYYIRVFLLINFNGYYKYDINDSRDYWIFQEYKKGFKCIEQPNYSNISDYLSYEEIFEMFDRRHFIIYMVKDTVLYPNGYKNIENRGSIRICKKNNKL